eukprot:6080060-Pleurochrysis_carterae.AAC.1
MAAARERVKAEKSAGRQRQELTAEIHNRVCASTTRTYIPVRARGYPGTQTNGRERASASARTRETVCALRTHALARTRAICLRPRMQSIAPT